MKLVSLNLMHGEQEGPIKEFLTEHQDADIFCLQEAEKESALPEFFSRYQRFVAAKHVGTKANFDQATFVHPRHQVSDVVELLQDEHECGLAIAMTITSPEGRVFRLLNLHGTARALVDGVFLEEDDKRDFPARLRQSEAVLEWARLTAAPTCIVGDFNLLPDTESIRMFARVGYRDLIQGYGIKSTRTHYSLDKYPEDRRYYFSDYIFLSPEIQVKSFTLPEVEVSDHLPLLVEIELP